MSVVNVNAVTSINENPFISLRAAANRFNLAILQNVT